MKCNSYEIFFDAFSNRTRMRIIGALRSGPKSVSQLCRLIGEEQSKVSHNLKRLSLCNFLDVRKAGKKRIYSLNKGTIIPILKLVERHVRTYCRGICQNSK